MTDALARPQDIQEAHYRETSVAPSQPQDVDASKVVAIYDELQQIFNRVLDASDFFPIENKQTGEIKRAVKAEAVNKLIFPLGVSFDIVSVNEHGEPGTRREVVETVNARGAKTYTVLYTVTLRARTMFGHDVTVESSYDSTEVSYVESDNTMRAKAQTRARKKAMKILLGIDADDPEDRRRNNKAAADGRREAGEFATRKLIPFEELFARAASLGVVPDDTRAFADWIAERVAGCADVVQRKRITGEQSLAINAVLNEIAARASERAPA